MMDFIGEAFFTKVLQYAKRENYSIELMVFLPRFCPKITGFEKE
jgi:hypothetical protein